MLKKAIHENVHIHEIPGISVRIVARTTSGHEDIVCLALKGGTPDSWDVSRGIACNRLIRLHNSPDKAACIAETVGYRPSSERQQPVQRRLRATPEQIVEKFKTLNLRVPDIVPQTRSEVRKEKFIGRMPRLSRVLGLQL